MFHLQTHFWNSIYYKDFSKFRLYFLQNWQTKWNFLINGSFTTFYYVQDGWLCIDVISEWGLKGTHKFCSIENAFAFEIFFCFIWVNILIGPLTEMWLLLIQIIWWLIRRRTNRKYICLSHKYQLNNTCYVRVFIRL